MEYLLLYFCCYVFAASLWIAIRERSKWSKLDAELWRQSPLAEVEGGINQSGAE